MKRILKMNVRGLSKTVRKSLLWTATLALISTLAVGQQQPVRYDAGTISGLPSRNIGSAEMSGCAAAVPAFTDNGRLVVYAGAASGGVWKSINGGSPFKP